MPQTPNHDYNVPKEGSKDWHIPLNENFKQYDTDIEIRDAESNRSDYEPKAGAKFLATDSGKVFLGDGNAWTHVPTTGLTPEFTQLNPNNTFLGIGTNPARPLDIQGQNNWDLDNSDGDVRIGNEDYRLAIGVALGGAGAGNADIRAKGGDQLKLGAGTAGSVVSISDVGVEMTADSGEDGDVLHVENTTDKTDGRAISGITQADWNIGVYGKATGKHGVGMVAEYVGEEGLGLSVDGGAKIGGGIDINGDLNVNGNKNFTQRVKTGDGPKEVVYTSTEAPTPHTEVSGTAELGNGRAEIDLPDHFDWVTDGEEPLVIQTTPYGGTAGIKVVERSTDRLVVEDLDGEGDYEFAYTVKGTRKGYADKEVLREPASQQPATAPSAPADD